MARNIFQLGVCSPLRICSFFFGLSCFVCVTWNSGSFWLHTYLCTPRVKQKPWLSAHLTPSHSELGWSPSSKTSHERFHLSICDLGAWWVLLWWFMCSRKRPRAQAIQEETKEAVTAGLRALLEIRCALIKRDKVGSRGNNTSRFAKGVTFAYCMFWGQDTFWGHTQIQRNLNTTFLRRQKFFNVTLKITLYRGCFTWAPTGRGNIFSTL
jgi:hypothetical protein